MADWTIRIAQLPVAPLGSRFNHNMIVVMDPAGRVVWELNGGPVADRTERSFLSATREWV
jgi:hypothetical protein